MSAATITPTLSQRSNPWREALAGYARPRTGLALADLATSVVPYVALFAGMALLAGISPWLALVLAVPAAGFLVRTFIVFHDCTHGSFLPGRYPNLVVGRVTGLMTFACFDTWKASHAAHHATAGDLDRRGHGDVPTLTVPEYRARTPRERLGYRLIRNPLVMFGLGPIWSMVIAPRLTTRGMTVRARRSVHLTNVALVVVIAGLVWLLGWRTLLVVQGPAILLAGAAGVWLFYVQHQFEDVYWESSEDWSYADAALRGSSHLTLGRVLQFFTGNIGLHHVHHLSARIPNYSLQAAHDDNPVFHDVPRISLRDGLRATRLKLYDPVRGRLVTWREARRGSRRT